MMGTGGIRPETTEVFYSDSTQFATYAFWISLMQGHGEAKIMNGTRGLWKKEGRPIYDENCLIACVWPAASG